MERRRLVLNLIITGIPSILEGSKKIQYIQYYCVLNLVISGIPSILNNAKAIEKYFNEASNKF